MGFYSTYEELKLDSVQTAVDPIQSFYSTYEELKRSKKCYRYFAFAKFLQYLWGIETFSFLLLFFLSHLVFTVPMRNWNGVSVLKQPLL